jgi:hypothetical protein
VEKTWAGLSAEVLYDTIVLNVDKVTPPPTVCTDEDWGAPQTTPTVVIGCAFQSSTASGPIAVISFECLTNGRSVLRLVPQSEDQGYGSQVFDENAVPYSLDLTDSEVTCGAGGALKTVAVPTSPSTSDVATANAGPPATPVPGTTAAAQATSFIGTIVAEGTVPGYAATVRAAASAPTANATEVEQAKTPGSPAQKTTTAVAEKSSDAEARAGSALQKTAVAAAGSARTDSGNGGSHTGLIIGIIVAVAVVALAGAGGAVLWRRRAGTP